MTIGISKRIREQARDRCRERAVELMQERMQTTTDVGCMSLSFQSKTPNHRILVEGKEPSKGTNNEPPSNLL